MDLNTPSGRNARTGGVGLGTFTESVDDQEQEGRQTVISWIETQIGLPRDGDLCLIYAKSRGSVLGPIAFRASRAGSGAWIDPSLGNARIGPGEVSHWCTFNAPGEVDR